MIRISLVCSVHREKGLCNAEEPLKILREIEPEVVFAEFSSSELDSFYKRGNVEARAITKYREFKLFQMVPVDRYGDPEPVKTKRNLDRMFDFVKEVSQEYLELEDIEHNDACNYGFKYLNSVVHEKLTARLCEIEEKTIIGAGDQGLIRILECWLQDKQRRDLEMVRNIYEYSRENAFDTGVFLVGAGHKTGIIKETEKYATTEANLINWNFTYGQNL